MGAWIEIAGWAKLKSGSNVAPYMGAWIEIPSLNSRPLFAPVAPYMGAWIEILMPILTMYEQECRSLHGGVD